MVELSSWEYSCSHSVLYKRSLHLFFFRVQTSTVKMITYTHQILVPPAEFRELKSLFIKKGDDSLIRGRVGRPPG